MYRHLVYVVAIAWLGTCALWAQIAAPRKDARGGDASITAVTGESWLTHLNRSFNDSSMGRTGRLGPTPGMGEAIVTASSSIPLPSSNGKVRLRGSDLYRLNCRGCHGESGAGAPPEINSILHPVQATSVELVMERMKGVGMDMSRAEAGVLARQANAALLQRLHQGGENMPAFSQLNEMEIRSLLAYLRELADLPGATNGQLAVAESHLRVGELIVKSTCHTCHSAVGPNPSPQELLDGAIPPLSSLTKRKTEPEFIQKVTQGAPVMMGTPSLASRGRMPVFFYLSEQEAADVYLYLSLYPPTDQVNGAPLMASMESVQPPSDNGKGTSTGLLVASEKASGSSDAAIHSDGQMDALHWTEALAALLLAGGLVFTFREFRRLSPSGAKPHPGKLKPRTEPVPGLSLGAVGQGVFSRLIDANKGSSQ